MLYLNLYNAIGYLLTIKKNPQKKKKKKKLQQQEEQFKKQN